MSIFDSDLVEREYFVKDFYNVVVYNAAYGTIEENIKRIFGSHVLNYIELKTYIYDFFKNMKLEEFNKLISSFKNQEHNHWKKQRKLHRFLKRKMKVRLKYIKESHFLSGTQRCTIFIPNGESIEMATADGIMIAFLDKSLHTLCTP